MQINMVANSKLAKMWGRRVTTAFTGPGRIKIKQHVPFVDLYQVLLF